MGAGVDQEGSFEMDLLLVCTSHELAGVMWPWKVRVSRARGEVTEMAEPGSVWRCAAAGQETTVVN